jgi:heptosyltransferase I
VTGEAEPGSPEKPARLRHMPAWLPQNPAILIVKLSAVGDVVHTLPALLAIRQAYPGARIGWAVHPGAANLLEGHPALDELITIPRRPGIRGMRAVSASLKGGGGRWDCAIDFQGLTKSGIAALLSGAPKRVGFAGANSRELNRVFINESVIPRQVNVIRMNLELLEALGIADSRAIAELHWTDADEAKVRAWAAATGAAGERFLFVDPFAGWKSKLWAEENWVQLACLAHEALGFRILIFYGPGERDHAGQLASRIEARRCPCVLAPNTTLRQYAALVRLHGAAIVAGDTGPMHIAAAAGVPTVAMFGPSSAVRNAPAFSNARYAVLQDESQPCAGTFARECPHHQAGACMATIEPPMVLEKLQNLLQELPPA